MSKPLLVTLVYLLFILQILHYSKSHAQSVGSATINSNGNTYTHNDIIYEWSVGELALIETMFNSKGNITNGLLQPVLPIHIITDGFKIFPNNILTANGDGKNDTWIIDDIEKYPDNEVSIFDGAGRIVFTAKNYQNTWNGTLAGIPLAEDTYYYIITLKKGSQTGLIKGFITIIY